MKQSIIDAYDNFQIADFDDDMVGMCKALVDWIKVLRAELPGEQFPTNEVPEKFHKMHPHQPRMELRKNLRNALAHATKYQEEQDFAIKVMNLYVMILAATYVYHMPTEKMIEASLLSSEFTRKDSEKMLLDDDMSPNWLKEPSGRDFTAIML